MKRIEKFLKSTLAHAQTRKWLRSSQGDEPERFKEQFEQFRRLQLSAHRSESISWDERYICREDSTALTGFDRHYIYHPAWAARIIALTSPEVHVDISSSLTFCSIVSAFVPVEFYDFRPAPLKLTNLLCEQQDLTKLNFADNSINSLSCMHVIEHIGLGRYGDPIDASGDISAMKELSRVLAPSGNLLVVVPVGKGKIHFNAHRVYRHRDVLAYFADLELKSFALVPDGSAPDGLIGGAPESLADRQEYGCGCYWFQKS